MTAGAEGRGARLAHCLVLGCAAALFAPGAAAQSAPLSGLASPAAGGNFGEASEHPVPWHDTLFIWDHSATLHTLGIGRDYQSWDPTYEMTFRLAPRYALFDNGVRNLTVRADLGLLREFTNSDSTTEEGEWTFTDAELWLAETQALRPKLAPKTNLVLRAPLLVFPTSKTSYRSGRILGLGVGVGLDQELYLRGPDTTALPSIFFRPRVTYVYQLARAVVPTNDSIDRVRLDPEGRTVPSDQLAGSAIAQHILTVSLRADTNLVQDLSLAVDLGMRYARRYALMADVAICDVATGCADVPFAQSAPRWGVSTLMVVGLDYHLTRFANVSLGYANLSPQLGADGQRRSFLYSPSARAFLSLTFVLDRFYGHDTPRR